MEKTICTVSLSFEEFYQKYYHEVVRYLSRKCASVQDAEDLAQNVFHYCWKNFKSYDPSKASYRSWLYVIVTSRWKNYCKEHRCTQDIETYANILADEKSDVEAAVDMDTIQDMTANLLMKLEKKDRDIVVLRFFMKKSFAQIAELMGMKEAAVRKRNQRAIEKMRDIAPEHFGGGWL